MTDDAITDPFVWQRLFDVAAHADEHMVADIDGPWRRLDVMELLFKLTAGNLTEHLRRFAHIRIPKDGARLAPLALYNI